MKKISFLLVALLLVLSLAACGSNTNNGGESANSNSGTDKADTGKEVVIKFPSYKTGNNVGAIFYLPQIERFNQKYAGKYKIEIEEIVQDEYSKKIKLLYQQKKLPPLIEVDKELADIMINNGDLLDLKPYIDNNPEINSILIEDSVKYNTDKNGKIVSLPLAFERPIGLYYNKELLQKAGITEPSATWDGFFSDLDKLKAAGVTPLALMTGENGWTTMLLASAMIASVPEGQDLLAKGDIVTNFNSPLWINTFAKVQKLLTDYTTKSALGATYSIAANEFFSDNTAMIANGPWMVGDFSNPDKASDGFAGKVGATIYPNGVALGSADGYWYSIPKDTPQETVDGLIEYFKFIYSPEELNAFLVAEGGFAPKLPMPDDAKAKLDPILRQLNDEVGSKMKTLNRLIYDIVPQSVSDLFAKNLPLLATNDMTPEQFCKAMTDAAEKFKK
ncbi:ABC transporter substrate-binding protein [Paenibacillus lignilyticus]|uniref:Carbohydrate ABC transporter substrate-binding protein n=1 Tax=Paenibacillus lignilyticus TaxID=1172615 RepID=A0ABS5CCT8_9BACL|nr:carbohydrate ABC transporter substrate-binding protein [Paenibacillus lignilyticus]MBP3963738.1 carbohydrate ABC transporter substrate-binding protein [Paenibacillus lignilyticus]